MALRALSLALAAGLAATIAPAHAGTVEVRLDPAAAWTDAGETAHERDATLESLSTALRALGPHLPGNQQELRVTLRDVDRAGAVRPTAFGRQAVRVVRHGADGPRIHLQYVLLDGGRELRRGDETLSELDYGRRAGRIDAADTLGAEKRLLADWFERRIVAGADAPQ